MTNREIITAIEHEVETIREIVCTNEDNGIFSGNINWQFFVKRIDAITKEQDTGFNGTVFQFPKINKAK